jgi:hypothetical protein
VDTVGINPAGVTILMLASWLLGGGLLAGLAGVQIRGELLRHWLMASAVALGLLWVAGVRHF